MVDGLEKYFVMRSVLSVGGRNGAMPFTFHEKMRKDCFVLSWRGGGGGRESLGAAADKGGLDARRRRLRGCGLTSPMLEVMISIKGLYVECGWYEHVINGLPYSDLRRHPKGNSLQSLACSAAWTLERNMSVAY